MDDPLPKTAQDHYTYRINNFHPSLDNITISILKEMFEGQVYTGHPVWRNARVINGSINIYPDPTHGLHEYPEMKMRLTPISCFPNNYYEHFVAISICSLSCWHSEGVVLVEQNWSLYPDVNKLIKAKVLLLLPATSTEAEQETFFSLIRRIKAWLRSTVSGKRFNNFLFTGSPQGCCRSASFKDHYQWIFC